MTVDERARVKYHHGKRCSFPYTHVVGDHFVYVDPHDTDIVNWSVHDETGRRLLHGHERDLSWPNDTVGSRDMAYRRALASAGIGRTEPCL